jgi:glycosyltransferase involved in cell wall biosynthesis
MRIALTLPSLAGGGAQRVFLDLAQGLLDRSIDVDVVLVRDEGPLRDSVPSGAELVTLGGKEVSRAVPRLARYLRSRRPDVVVPAITHMNLCTLLAARLVRPRVPVVVTGVNHLTTAARHAVLFQDRITPRLARVGYPWADAVVALSEGVADDVASAARLPRSRVEVIPSPVNFGRLAAAAREQTDHPWLVDKTGPVLLAAGRLTEQKDFPTLLRALALLDDDIRLVLLGEGELRASLERLAQELGIAKRVDFPGFSRNHYPACAACDVFVLSSKWEGLPTVLIEALFLGAPIVSTDCPSGPAEILEGGRWGRLVPPGEPEALARAIRATLADGRRPVGPAACDRVRIDTVSERWAELLGRAARHSRRPMERPLMRP